MQGREREIDTLLVLIPQPHTISQELFRFTKKVPSSIAIGNEELMQVFSETLAHVNSKNEIREI